MLSLFGILNMAGQSLSVEQEATSVTGQNLANVNNPAYSAQQLQIEAATPLQTADGQEGTGVQAVSITQLRDALLDAQIQAEGSVTGSLNSQQSALQDAEAYLNEQISGSAGTGATASAGGLTADLSGFFGALQTLSSNPTSIPDRQAVVQSAQQLTGQFNSVSFGLATVTSNLNASIQSDVNAGNQDLSQIASLNQQIVLAQGGGGTANDLIDQREKIIEDLAGKVNMTATTQANGAVNVSIGGVTMVSGGTTTDSLQTYTNASGNLLVQAQTAGTPLALAGGSIEGGITVRDGAVAALQTSLNTLAGALILQTSQIYNQGYDLNSNTGQSFLTGGNAADIGVNSALVSAPSTFQAAGASGVPGDNSVALALAQMDSGGLPPLSNQSYTQYYAQTVGAFGSSLQSVNEQLANSTSVSQMLASQRQSATGVNTDTEMTNLMQFQKAYQASAELITTLNQMLETIITMKTV